MTDTAIPLCIYHAKCFDGIGAAYVVDTFYHGNVEYYAGVYNTPPPDVTNRNVILVDFSYPSAILVQMAESANEIRIIDHHVSAIKDIETSDLTDHENVILDLDQNHSGCMLAWKHYYGEKEPPYFLKLLEDRDIWKFNFEETNSFHSGLGLLGLSNMEIREAIQQLRRCEEPDHLNYIIENGAVVLCYREQLIENIVSQTARRITLFGYEVPFVNCPPFLASDVGNRLAKNESFSITYHDEAKYRHLSFRSTDEGEDVSIIAKKLGGGGHRNASGAKVPLTHPLANSRITDINDDTININNHILDFIDEAKVRGLFDIKAE